MKSQMINAQVEIVTLYVRTNTGFVYNFATRNIIILQLSFVMYLEILALASHEHHPSKNS